MNQATISDACTEFYNLIEVLDDAYWEASTIVNKDTIFNVLSVFQKENAELNKLSIQDHHYAYEMVTEDVQHIGPELHRLETQIDTFIARSSTQVRLRNLLHRVIEIIDQAK